MMYGEYQEQRSSLNIHKHTFLEEDKLTEISKKNTLILIPDVCRDLENPC